MAFPSSTSPRCQLVGRLLIIVVALGTTGRAAAAIDPDTARRVLTLTVVVGEEYRESFDEGGALVRPLEYEEARSFLAEAQMRWAHAGDTAEAAPVGAQLTELSEMLEQKAPLAAIIGQIEAIRTAVATATGVVASDIYPTRPPSAQHGAALFGEYCASCHGEHGDGRGPEAARLERKPANFTDAAFMRAETPYDFFHVITLGKRGAAMPAWEDVLTPEERWDVLSHVWGLGHASAQLAEGQGIYLTQCAGCHGATGDGSGPYSATLLTPAPDLATPRALGQRSGTDLFDAVRTGIAGTPMPAFRGLSDDETWKVVAFVRSLSLGDGATETAPSTTGGPAGSPARFGRLARLLGSEYSKAIANGAVVSQHDLTEAEVLTTQVKASAPGVIATLRIGAPAAADTIQQHTDELAALIARRADPAELLRSIDALVSALPAEPASTESEATANVGSPGPIAATRALLVTALAAYERKDATAISVVSDAYFEFEPLERKLASVAPDLTLQIEARFLELRGIMGRPGGDADAAAVIRTIGSDLDAVAAALAPRSNPYTLFLQSATIILREGFEVVLIIGALLAYVVKSGNPHMRRPIYLGTVAGIGFSLAVGYLFMQLFSGTTGGAADALEGATMLLAAMVLFWVSYWLVSKAEADKWQRYIQGKVKTALSLGSGFALASAAFLAVAREGVETMLFYQALFGSARGATGTVIGGIVAGGAVLAVVYVIFMRLGMRLPIRQFFLGTSLLLYYMAMVFTGKGIAELQEAGWITVTAIPGAPRIDFIGLYPTWETLVGQGILLVLLLYAVWVTWPRRAHTPAEVNHPEQPGAKVVGA